MKWYKRDPEAFAGGTAELSLEEVGAYTRIIDLIYSRDGNVPDDERFLSMALRCDVRVWRRVRKRLIDCGKIQTSAGLIVNLRATSEISYAQVRMKKDRKRNENKPANLILAPILTTTTTVREEKKEERAATSAAAPKRTVKTTLPESWHPMEVLSPSESLEFEKMRDWAKAGAIRKADWFATWRNWKRRSPQFNGGGNGSRSLFDGQPARGSREDLRRRTVAALDQLREYGDAGPDDEGGCNEAGAPSSRGFPKLIGP